VPRELVARYLTSTTPAPRTKENIIMHVPFPNDPKPVDPNDRTQSEVI